jgi:hypothetical protein
MPTVNHDWSDFAISNGILYDFNGKSSTTATHYESIDHINLQTGATAATYNYATMGFVPRQVSVDWTEKLYNVGTAATASTGTIVPYATGAINTAFQYNLTVGSSTPSGSWGDAAEAFRPKADFGDAPSSYDPDPMAPALHEVISTLRIGNSIDVEWNKIALPGTDADTDGSDEDGLTFVRIMNMRSGNYQTDVTVFNNTLDSAIVAAWVDFNGDGAFQTSEGITVKVPASTGLQTVSLYWTGITANLPEYSSTYLRIRITSKVNGMTTSNPTGYFADGEVEDYKVLVNMTPLDVTLKNFSAKKAGDNRAKLTWNVLDEKLNTTYELQNSIDGINWKSIYKTTSTENKWNVAYSFDDLNVTQLVVYYRLKLSAINKIDGFSAVQKVTFNQQPVLTISPNPTASQCKLQIAATEKDNAQVRIVAVSGKTVYAGTYNLEKGINVFVLPTQDLQDGVYTVQVITTLKYTSAKLVVQKK